MASVNSLPDVHITGPDDTMEITTPGGNADDMIDIDVDISGISPGKDQEGDYLLDDASDYGQQQEPTDPNHHQDQVMEDDEFLVDDDGGMVEDTHEDVHFRDASYDEEVQDAPEAEQNANQGQEIDLQDQEVDVIHFDDPTQADSTAGERHSNAFTASHNTEPVSSMEREDVSKLGQPGNSMAHSYEVHDSTQAEHTGLQDEVANDSLPVQAETWQENQTTAETAKQQSTEDSQEHPAQDAEPTTATIKDDNPSANEASNETIADKGNSNIPRDEEDGEPTEQSAHGGNEAIDPQSHDSSAEHPDHLHVEPHDDDNESELHFEDDEHEDNQEADANPTQENTVTGGSSPLHDVTESKDPEADASVQETAQAEKANDSHLEEQQDGTSYTGDESHYVENEAAVNSEHHSTQQDHADRPSHHVVVDWAGEQYPLFPGAGDGQEFFVQDESLVNNSIQKLLGACRDALGESVSDGEVVEFEIVELGLYISEVRFQSDTHWWIC
jgi:hypothetical protein